MATELKSAVPPIPLLGGKSVQWINEQQMAEARRMAGENSQSSEIIQEMLSTVEDRLNRNERAALAFIIISRLKQTLPA